MQVTTSKAAPQKRISLARRLTIWWKMRGLNYLRSESLQEWAEIERTQKRIEALDKEIQRKAHEITLLQLKK
jgi:hypothetical protein